MWQIIVGVVIVAIAFTLALIFAPKGWRTVIANTLAAVPVIGEFVGSITDQLINVNFGDYFTNPTTAKTVALSVLVMNVILRAITTTAVGKKG